jgi:hypothetical protein
VSRIETIIGCANEGEADRGSQMALSAARTVPLSHRTCQERDMLSGKQRETQMSEDASAIKTAFIDHPGSGHGATWDPSNEK